MMTCLLPGSPNLFVVSVSFPCFCCSAPRRVFARECLAAGVRLAATEDAVLACYSAMPIDQTLEEGRFADSAALIGDIKRFTPVCSPNGAAQQLQQDSALGSKDYKHKLLTVALLFPR